MSNGLTVLERGARLALIGIRALVAISRVPDNLRHMGSIYLLVHSAGVPGASAGRVIGVTKQYVSKAVSQIEQRRTADPDIDAAFVELEETLFPEDL